MKVTIDVPQKYRSTLKGLVTKVLYQHALDISLRDEVMQLVQTKVDIPVAIELVLESKNG